MVDKKGTTGPRPPARPAPPVEKKGNYTPATDKRPGPPPKTSK